MDIESISSENLNKELAYLLGVYLTDGSISKQESFTFSLKAIDRDFVENTLRAYKAINPQCTASVYEQAPRTRYWDDGRVSKTQIQYCINVGFAKYGARFKEWTGDKHHLPTIIWNAPLQVKRWFIAGIMDGDGWISKTPRPIPSKRSQYRLGIGGIKDGWVWEFEKLLQKMGVKTCKPEICVDKRKTPFVRFSINNESFTSNGLFFTILRKQNRLLDYIKERSET